MNLEESKTKYMVLNLFENKFKFYTLLLVFIGGLIRIPVIAEMNEFISVFNIFTIGIVSVLIIDYFFFSNFFEKFQWIFSLLGLILILAISLFLTSNFSIYTILASSANKFRAILSVSFIAAIAYNLFIWVIIVKSKGETIGNIYRIESPFILKLQKISRLKFEYIIDEKKSNEKNNNNISIGVILDRYTYKFFSNSSEFKIYLLKRKRLEKNNSKKGFIENSKLLFQKKSIVEINRANNFAVRKINKKNIIVQNKRIFPLPYHISIVIYFMIFEFFEYKIYKGILILSIILCIILVCSIYEIIRCNTFNKYDRRYLGFVIGISGMMAIFILVNIGVLYFYFSNSIIINSIIIFHIFFTIYMYLMAYFYGDKKNLQKLEKYIRETCII